MMQHPLLALFARGLISPWLLHPGSGQEVGDALW
jgi:hypothetical protein